MNKSPKIGIIGTGYVGLVTGVCFAELGFEVICGDVIKSKVDQINQGNPPIYEDGLDDILPKLVETGLIRATLDTKEVIENTDLIFICTGTPSNSDGSIDLSYIKSASEDIAKSLKDVESYKVIVVKSTVIPGTTSNFVKPILEKLSKKNVNDDFGLAMNPEFLKEGVAINDFQHPDRVVIGAEDDKAFKLVSKLYQSFTCPILHVDPSTAEMIKYASNSFLAVKISFINEIANMAETIGVDIDAVVKGLGLDQRISDKFLRPGIGFGGSCFPKDVRALARMAKDNDLSAKMLDAALEVNEFQPLRVIEIIQKKIEVKGSKIALLGLAFKPQTDDIRESRAIPIAEKLVEFGVNVVCYDPIAYDNAVNYLPNQVQIVNSVEDTIQGADVTVLVTEWNEFKTIPFAIWQTMRGRLVIDGRRILDKKLFEENNFELHVIGG